jgi:hypothetical protein
MRVTNIVIHRTAWETLIPGEGRNEGIVKDYLLIYYYYYYYYYYLLVLTFELSPFFVKGFQDRVWQTICPG